jgi:rRNA maturation endonuclease Nob1
MDTSEALWWCAKCAHACSRTFQRISDPATPRCNACGEAVRVHDAASLDAELYRQEARDAAREASWT